MKRSGLPEMDVRPLRGLRPKRKLTLEKADDQQNATAIAKIGLAVFQMTKMGQDPAARLQDLADLKRTSGKE